MVVFALIKATIGLRVSAEQEEAGLDIVEHGMYGYPEQFIPEAEIGTGLPPEMAPRGAHAGATATAVRAGEVPA